MSFTTHEHTVQLYPVGHKEFWESFHQLSYTDASDPRYQREIAQIARDTLEDDFTHLQRRMRQWTAPRTVQATPPPRVTLPSPRFGFDRRLAEVLNRKW